MEVQNEARLRLDAYSIRMLKRIGDLGNIIIRQHPTPTKRHSVLLGAVMKADENANAIRHLAQINAIDEMHVLLRTFVEMTVNVCYLQYASEAEIERFIHHDAIAGLISLEDFNRAQAGISKVPADLERRTAAHAANASTASGLSVKARQWSSETKNLFDRAKIVDDSVGNADLRTLMASTYVSGSGYDHGSFKTLHKHAYYLRTGQVRHRLETAFGVNCAIQGLIYASHMFARFLAAYVGNATEEMDKDGREATAITEMATEDFKRHNALREHK